MHRLLVLCTFVPLVACAAAPAARTHVTAHPGGAPRWQVTLVDGVPEGLSVTWHPDGRVASRGYFRNGAREGSFIYYDELGREIRREVYRADVLVESDRPPGGPGVGALADPAIAAPGPGPAPAHRYTDVRVSTGMGGSDAARRAEGSGGEAVVALSGAVLVRRDSLVYGGSLHLAGELFGADHTYVGGVLGLATGDRAQVQLLAEGGVHTVSNLGEDLFDESYGDNSASLPYVGTQLRLSFDPGARGHVIFDLAAAARRDVGSARREVMIESCFLGCSTEYETWRAGGRTFDVSLGVGYRFD